ncbi:MAG: response regulator [Candidatus Sumerlaeia bacterium]|nr:response regulator [Candidatus Sumerlaeia bacterium]
MKPIHVLIADDNAMYRQAFARNLRLQGYEVFEAENADDAMAIVRTQSDPLVVVTDLAMRTDREGLDLIRRLKSERPLLPIILISAVGTFEEGAMATQYGAARVFSKSRIEEELDPLYDEINRCHASYLKNAAILRHVRNLGEQMDTMESGEVEATVAHLQEVLGDGEVLPYVKGEVFERLLDLRSAEVRAALQKKASLLIESAPNGKPALGLKEVDDLLRAELSTFDRLSPESHEALRTAEFLYRQQSRLGQEIDLSRNIGFSYCFAVENEAKVVLRRKLTRFLEAKSTYKLLEVLYNYKTRSLDLFFHQYLLQLQHQRRLEVTIENVAQTFARIREHEARYKPDGLKALGIIIFCFGRTYEFRRGTVPMLIDNPLNLKGLDDDNEVLTFAELLTGLQHYRNPYIHPEISDMQKVSKIRDTTLRCLTCIGKLV